MKAEYKRDLNKNYLILELKQEKEIQGYGLRMAEQNEIPGLLRFHSTKRDGTRYLNYEITSRQPLDGKYERSVMGYQDILNLLTDVRDVMEAMQKFLLEPLHLIFHPEYIFVGADRRAAFCYFPDKKEENPIVSLAEFILKRLDHEDAQAVELGYRFYQSVCEENFSFTKVWKELILTVDARREAAEEPAEGVNEHKTEETKIREYREREYKETEREAEPVLPLDYDLQGYDVIHKERKKKQKVKKTDWIFGKVHPVILFSSLVFLAAIEILFYFQVIQLTEAGGLFFLTISAELLAYRFWKSKKEKKKSYTRYEPYEEEDPAYELLKEEMYSEKEEEEIPETCCLTTVLDQRGIRLVHISGETGERIYPDICLREQVLFIGKRKGESDVILNSPSVSRMHARLEGKNGQYFVKDLNSRNGTYCNDQRLHPQKQREIAVGDTVTFAQIVYRVVRI